MSRTYYETMLAVQQSIDKMRHDLSIMYRIYTRYVEHGAVNAAAEQLEKIQHLEAGIEAEEYMFRCTF